MGHFENNKIKELLKNNGKNCETAKTKRFL